MFRRYLAKTHQVLQSGLTFVIRFYRYAISPLLGPRCRFYPTCSEYALDALRHFNLAKSCYLIFRRIIRCHPFHPGGFDPLVVLNPHSPSGTTQDTPNMCD